VPTIPAVGQVVTFTGSAAGAEPITYSWKLDVESWQVGPVVTHSYAATGTYPVVMTATNACGAAVVSHTVPVTLTPVCTPVEIVTVTTAISGCQVSFESELLGDPPFVYLWTFGDGLTSTAVMPVHDYSASGTYSGTLALENCGGEGHDEESFVVRVECAPPEAYWIFLPLVMRGE